MSMQKRVKERRLPPPSSSLILRLPSILCGVPFQIWEKRGREEIRRGHEPRIVRARVKERTRLLKVWPLTISPSSSPSYPLPSPASFLGDNEGEKRRRRPRRGGEGGEGRTREKALTASSSSPKHISCQSVSSSPYSPFFFFFLPPPLTATMAREKEGRRKMWEGREPRRRRFLASFPPSSDQATRTNERGRPGMPPPSPSLTLPFFFPSLQGGKLRPWGGEGGGGDAYYV